MKPAQFETHEPVAWDNCLGEKQCRSWCGNSACVSHWNYTTPPQRKPLTDEEMHEAIGTAGVDLLELAKQWSDNKIHVYQFDNEARKIIKAVLSRALAIEAAHGIKDNT